MIENHAILSKNHNKVKESNHMEDFRNGEYPEGSVLENLVVFNNFHEEAMEFEKHPVSTVDVEDPNLQLTRENLTFD